VARAVQPVELVDIARKAVKNARVRLLCVKMARKGFFSTKRTQGLLMAVLRAF